MTGKKLMIPAGSFIILASILFFFWEDLFFTPDHWVQDIPDIGSLSSPRAVDLTNDGILDIVMGGGGPEFASTEYGVFALDGKDGVIGSPVFRDLNEDEIPDVIIGGRSSILYAINGKNGELFWEYMPDHDSLDIVNDRSILNFYNPQFIPDQDEDGIDDLLIAYGGYIKAAPDEKRSPTR